MIIIKADTLELAMSEASEKFDCSVTQLQIEVVEHPRSGVLGFFKKQAVIAAVKKDISESEKEQTAAGEEESKQDEKASEPTLKENSRKNKKITKDKPNEKQKSTRERQSFSSPQHDMINPSLVTAQDDYEAYDENEYKRSQSSFEVSQSKEDIQRRIAQQEEEDASIKRMTKSEGYSKSAVVDDFFQNSLSMEEIAFEVDQNINRLFEKSCFDLQKVAVSVYDDNTLLIEFSGEDAALLIGKEGYRYKALSYMLFNWINAKYGVQLRLEIADFLKNQEEMVYKYLQSVNEQIENSGRAQTKILDGVLVQIALKKLRTTFPDKYIAIRTNRDGLKYIIINSFRNNNG